MVDIVIVIAITIAAPQMVAIKNFMNKTCNEVKWMDCGLEFPIGYSRFVRLVCLFCLFFLSSSRCARCECMAKLYRCVAWLAHISLNSVIEDDGCAYGHVPIATTATLYSSPFHFWFMHMKRHCQSVSRWFFFVLWVLLIYNVWLNWKWSSIVWRCSFSI